MSKTTPTHQMSFRYAFATYDRVMNRDMCSLAELLEDLAQALQMTAAGDLVVRHRLDDTAIEKLLQGAGEASSIRDYKMTGVRDGVWRNWVAFAAYLAVVMKCLEDPNDQQSRSIMRVLPVMPRKNDMRLHAGGSGPSDDIDLFYALLDSGQVNMTDLYAWAVDGFVPHAPKGDVLEQPKQSKQIGPARQKLLAGSPERIRYLLDRGARVVQDRSPYTGSPWPTARY